MGNDKTIPINVFRHSFRPILDLINEYDLRYQIRETRSGSAVASSGVIEVIVNASIWLSLASVVVAFIKAKNSREVMIQTKDNNVIHAKGLNSKQLELILKEAINITAIDTEMNRHPIALQIEKADKAIVAEDFDALMDIYTNDAILVVMPGVNAVGKDAILVAFKK